MRLCEKAKIVFLIDPQDHNAAGIDGDSFNMKNYGHATIILLFGELTGNSVLTIYEGATDGAKTAALTFSYRATAADLKVALGDALGTEATSAALTLTAATYEDRMIVAEIDANELTDGYDWITVEIDATATELLVAAVAILTEPRYAADTPPAAIPES